MRRSSLFAASMLAALAGTAHAQDRVQVGVLECRGGASIGFVVGSVTNLGCVLRIEGLPEDRYVATIRRVGLDLGITQETALAWAVYAPVNRLGPGDLSGNYAGAQGSASLGVGAGGNVLVGGSNNTVALQPLSLQGQIGVNIAAGLESLELRPGRCCSRPFSARAAWGKRLCVEISRCTAANFSRLPNSEVRQSMTLCRPNQGPSSK